MCIYGKQSKKIYTSLNAQLLLAHQCLFWNLGREKLVEL